jgi:hypothetical protein
VAERYRSRVAAVLTANSEFDVRAGCFTFFYGSFHQYADTGLVNRCKRVKFINVFVIVCVKELACIITRETESHLSKVVGTE